LYKTLAKIVKIIYKKLKRRVLGVTRRGALMEYAGILREAFRTSDIIARIGGDGFEVVSIEAHRENVHG